MAEVAMPSDAGKQPRASSVRLNPGPALPLLHQIPEGAEAMKPAAKQPITLSTAPPRKASKAEASIRITADASKQPQKDAIDKAPPAAGEAAKPQMPVLPRPAAPGAAAAKKDEPNVLTMPRDEAWPRLLAYEACLQVCIKATIEGAPEAIEFLQDSCAALKKAFGTQPLLLHPSAGGAASGAAGGAVLSWAEVKQLYTPPVEETVTQLRTTVAGFAGLELGKPDKVYVSLHASSQPEDRGVWTSLADCDMRDAVGMVPAERGSLLQVEVHNEQGLVAAGNIPIADLWQATEQRTAQATGGKAKAGLWRSKPKDGTAGAATPSVEVLDKDGNSAGHVRLCTALQQRSMAAPRPMGLIIKNPSVPVTVTTWQVYETVLQTALAEQRCGARSLALTGSWRWLLGEVAAQYGVRPTFAALSFLRWAAAPAHLTPTADCLAMLAQELRPLKRAQSSLLKEEVAILNEVTAACEALLGQTFEGYHSLSEKEPCGILSGGASGPESPAPAVAPAVRLFGILKEEGLLRDTVWLQDRLRTAAQRRYYRLYRNCVKRITENGYVGENKRTTKLAPIEEVGKITGDELTYRRLEALCVSIRAELENDQLIAETGVYPPHVDLPAVTAREYCHELISKIAEVLKESPPLKPSNAAVELLLAVGRLQDYVATSGSAPPPGARGYLDGPAIFAPHIDHWIDTSQETLCKTCLQLEQEGPEGSPATGNSSPRNSSPLKKPTPAVLPLVPAMLGKLKAELGLYQRILTYWPQFGPGLEYGICAALRDTISATSRQCGLVQQKPAAAPVPQVPDVRESPRKLFGRKSKQPAVVAPPLAPVAEAGPKSPSKRMPWQWRAPGGESSSVVQAGVAPHEALLLNSLRQLLSAAPVMESTLEGWCLAGRKERRRANSRPNSREGSDDGQPDARSDGLDVTGGNSDPELGQHFLQVVGELRSQYAVGIKLAAQRLADAAFATPLTAPAAILDQLWEAIGPVLDSKQPYWQRLHQPPDPKLNSQQHVAPLVKVLKDTVAELAIALDGRVLVALTRGLWELTSKEIYDYLEGLQESFDTKNAWRSRQNAALMLDHVDQFFRDCIGAGPKSGASLQGNVPLQEQDLERPFHSNKAHMLLAANTSGSNMSFNPY